MMKTSSTWRTPAEFASEVLGGLGPGQRGLVFVIDPEMRLPWPEDGDSRITDASSREWRLLSYRGNDMGLRARFALDQPTIIWVRPAPMEGSDSIDITTLADLIALADTFIDVSLAGMLASMLPGVPLPVEIAAWAPQAAEDPASFVRGLKKVLEYRGRPVSRRHILAAAVCQASPRVTPAIAWMDDSDMPTLLVSYLHLVSLDQSDTLRSAAGEAFRHVASLLGTPGAGLKPTDFAGRILQIPADALVEQFYWLAAARRHGIAGSPSVLANHGLLESDFGSLLAEQPEIWPILCDAAYHLDQRDEALRAVAREAERRVDAARLRKIQGMLAKSARQWATEPTAAVRLAMMGRVVEEDGEPLNPGDFTVDVEQAIGAQRFVHAAEALQRVGHLLARYSSVQASAAAASSLDLEGLVNAYVRDVADAEYDFGRAARDLNLLSSILGEMKKVRDRVKEARAMCSELISAYNARLETLLRSDPNCLFESARAIHRWLPHSVAPLIEGNRRVWILVFDGLRWDLWDRILRPELERAGLAVTVDAGLGILPTETWLCRRTLLSGKSPLGWAGEGSIPSEETLIRSFFQSLGGAGGGLAYRLRAEEGEDTGAESFEPSRVNVWVYQIPDKYAHLSAGSLQDVATHFLTFLRANVIPALAENLTPGDLVFLGADHGFTTVSGDNTYTVSLPEDQIGDRLVSLKEHDPADLPGIEVKYPRLGRWCVAGGDLVYVPLGHNAPSRSFRHGGASLCELVVPLAQVRVPVQASGELALDLSGPTYMQEDSDGLFVARLYNGTSEKIKGQLLFESNLGLETRVPLLLAPGVQTERKCSITAREGLELVRVRLVSGEVTLRSRSLQVKVNLKPGIKLEGLEGLDDEF